MDLSRNSAMNNINGNNAAPTAYGSVQLGYVLVDSPRLDDWRRFAVDGVGMELAAGSSEALALRVDDHARRLVVRKSANEDVTLGWQATPQALELILQRLRRRDVDVDTAEGQDERLRHRRPRARSRRDHHAQAGSDDRLLAGNLRCEDFRLHRRPDR